MKVIKQKHEFAPVTIVLETQEELDYIKDCLSNPKIFYIINNSGSKTYNIRMVSSMYFELLNGIK